MVDKNYLSYLHEFDSRVSLKKDRPYVGLSVQKKLAQRIEIDPIKDTYLSNEYRYIRKHWVEITNKSLMIYLERYNENSRNNAFLQSICCDFKMLEEKCDEWIKKSSVRHWGRYGGKPPLEGVASNEVRARGRLSPPSHLNTAQAGAEGFFP